MWEDWDAQAQTSHTIEYLKSRDTTDPFCLFLSWGPPHHPYRLAPQKYLDMYDPDAIQGRPNCPDVPREDLWGYYAQTTFLDDQFQRLLNVLDELEITENTIVVFSSITVICTARTGYIRNNGLERSNQDTVCYSLPRTGC